MILGNTECDYDTAYFLKNGEYPKKENNCKYGLTNDDVDYYIHENRQDEYYCWRGSRIPCWFE